jgi:hypothetical protein
MAHFDNEYAGKSEDQQKALKKYRATLEIAKDYSLVHFDNCVRWYRLWVGEIPPELEGTYSKVMLQLAYAMIEQELPRAIRQIFNSPDWFDLDAKEPSLEYPAKAAQKWLQYQVDKVQNLPYTIIPTLQEAYLFGTGYRGYTHRYIKRQINRRREPAGRELGYGHGFHDVTDEELRSTISGSYINQFNVLPLPGGGLCNAYDTESDAVSDAVMLVTYETDSALKRAVEDESYNKDEVGRLLKAAGTDGDDPSAAFKDALVMDSEMWSRLPMPQWAQKIRAERINLAKRYRVVWLFEKDNWLAVGEDRFVLYDGPGAIDAKPIAKFSPSMNLNHWYGRGIVEIAEDILLTINLNLNARLDYMTMVMHPTTWISQTILDALPEGRRNLDPEPYGVRPFPAQVEDIRKALLHDRSPDISQQTFMEQGQMDELLQRITGMPTLLSGMAGGAPVEGGATGVTSLISEATVRSTFRARMIENSGLRESLWLTLKYGGKYRDEDELVKVTGADGWPWERVPHEAITDGYGINITGTRNFNLAEQTFQRMMAMAQLWMNNPLVENPKEALRQSFEAAGVWDNVDKILGSTEKAPPPMVPAGETPGVGGVPSVENTFRSRMGRNTVEPNTGRPTPAGAMIV